MEHPFIIFKLKFRDIRLIELSVLFDDDYDIWSLHLSRLHLAFLVYDEFNFNSRVSFRFQWGELRIGWFSFYVHLCWYPFS